MFKMVEIFTLLHFTVRAFIWWAFTLVYQFCWMSEFTKDLQARIWIGQGDGINVLYDIFNKLNF